MTTRPGRRRRGRLLLLGRRVGCKALARAAGGGIEVRSSAASEDEVDAREPLNRGHTESSLQAVGISPSGMGCARDSGEGMHDMVDQLVSGSGHAAVWSSTGSAQRCWEQSGRCGLHWGCSSGRVVVGRHVLSPREARVVRKCRSGTGRERVVVEEITVAAFVDAPITARRTKSTL